MGIDRKKGYFSISAVAKMFSVHQQTVRLYEKEGLISPKRSAGNTRMFSEDDVDKLEQIIYLTHQLGINLAGVEQILKLQRQIKKMQNDMNKLFEKTQENLNHEIELTKESVRASAQSLANMKQASTKTNNPAKNSNNAKNNLEKTHDLENWEVEYEE
jgi:MerR family transcriptional regulator/heat shock protein HspR